MSTFEPTNQFFPPLLKWTTLVFFGLTIAGVVIVAVFSPQLIQNQIKLVTDPHAQPSSTEALPTEHVSSATSSAELLSTNPTPTTTTQHTITSVEDVPVLPADPTAKQDIAPTEKAGDFKRCHYSGNQSPKIIGVTYKQKKYYYTPGNQPYYALQKLSKVERWFCRKSEAKQQGWVEGPDDILSKMSQDVHKSNSNTEAEDSRGLLGNVLDLIGL